MVWYKTTAFFILALIGLTGSAEAGLRIGVAAEPYPPFAVKDTTGKWDGWEIAMAQQLCATIKEDCEIVETAWDGIIPALQAKKIDVILASMSKTAKRREVISFSDTYYNTAIVVAGAKSNDKDITPEHLKSKVIGVQTSTIQQAYFDKHYAAFAKGQTYQTQDQANQDLVAGRVDYVITNALSLASFLSGDDGKCCEVKGTVAADEAVLGEGVGLGLRKEDTALATKLNDGLAAMAKTHEFEKLSAKFKMTGLIITPDMKAK